MTTVSARFARHLEAGIALATVGMPVLTAGAVALFTTDRWVDAADVLRLRGVTIALCSVPLLLAIVGINLMFTVTFVALSQKGKRLRRGAFVSVMIAVLELVTAITSGASLTSMYGRRERLVLPNATCVGWVLGTEADQWLLVLTHEERIVVRYRTDYIIQRSPLLREADAKESSCPTNEASIELMEADMRRRVGADASTPVDDG